MYASLSLYLVSICAELGTHSTECWATHPRDNDLALLFVMGKERDLSSTRMTSTAEKERRKKEERQQHRSPLSDNQCRSRGEKKKSFFVACANQKSLFAREKCSWKQAGNLLKDGNKLIHL